MIELNNVNFSYGNKPVIKDFSMSVRNGENLLITGPSGCGKTTVARLISGLITPDSGSIIAPQKLSVVFQEDRLINKLNVYKNICLPLNKETYKTADRLLYEFGLDDIKYKPIEALSGGMKRRVAIIRALAYGGDALIMDEPFNGIDKDNIGLICEIINREFKDKGKSIIIISHNASDAEYFGANVIEIKKPKS